MTTTTSSLPRTKYIVTSSIIIAVGAVLAVVFSHISPVQITPVEGVSTFAVLYVLAQALERINALLLPLGEKLLNSNGPDSTARATKVAGRRVLKSINREPPSALSAADISFYRTELNVPDEPVTNVKEAAQNVIKVAQKKMSGANAEMTLFTSAVSGSISLMLIGYFKYSLLDQIGVSGAAPWMGAVITATAVMGGTKGLHDLISNIQSKGSSDS